MSHRTVLVPHISTHPSTSHPHNQLHLRFSLMLFLETHGRMVSTVASYSGVPRFESRLGDQLSWLDFSVFQSIQENSGLLP